MKKILIFSGTTEGRELAGILANSGIVCDVCVATEYGEQVMEDNKNINVFCKRLNADEMRQLYIQNDYMAVVDATHPYATEVTRTIRESLEGTSLEYMRLLREASSLHNTNNTYDNAEECAKALQNTEGNILLTTGSKELSVFTQADGLRERIYARVIPSEESIQICINNGIKGKRIIAMQGPFSEEMNIALMRQYDIKHLVSKLSGREGGEDGKLRAAAKLGICAHLISRPIEKTDFSYSKSQIISRIETIAKLKIKNPEIIVNLAGIGCGNPQNMTEEVRACIENSDYIFGARRMIDSVSENTKAQKYPYYLADDIIPRINKIYENSFETVRVTILFSGDTGFYSGCKKLSEQLSYAGYDNLTIYPGISSVQAMAAACNLSWDDAKIMSSHGVCDDFALLRIADSVLYNKKVFFITSGISDIEYIGDKISKTENKGNIKIYIGYNITYEDEKIICVSPCDIGNAVRELPDKGLYTAVIINDSPYKRILTPKLKDDDFLRDKVPMTKENIRKLSICHLNLSADSVVYDIGSGSGSFAVDIALLSPNIGVYAIDCNESAISLIKRNIEKHNAYNISVVEGMAPDALKNLPLATHAFIGGSKGNIREILDELRRINSSMRIVMNAVSIESISQMNELLKTYPASDVDIISVSVSSIKKLGNYSMPDTGNAVYIFSFNLSEQ